MSWLEEQLKQRADNDDRILEDSYYDIAGAVLGKNLRIGKSDDVTAQNAIDDILRFFHIRPAEIQEKIDSPMERVDYVLRPHGIMRRSITLSKGWYKDAAGAMLGVRKDNGDLCALIPGKTFGYTFFNTETGTREKINRKNEGLFDETAAVFYKPFPLKKLSVGELMRYIIGVISPSDILRYVLAMLAATLLGLLMPKFNQMLFSDVLSLRSVSALAAIMVFMICVTISSLLMETVKAFVTSRINTKLAVSVEAATMMRILSLPPAFFKQYSSGELSNRSEYMTRLCGAIIQQIMSTGFASIFSLVYVFQIFAFAPSLVMPALCMTLLTAVISLLSALWQMKISRERMECAARENGMSYALISGIQKIKLTGAEKRMFARWGSTFAKSVKITYSPPVLLTLLPVMTLAVNLFGTLFIYSAAIRSHVSAADYFAFNASFGMVSGAFAALSGVALSIAEIKPILEMVRPILDSVPETAERKENVTRLSGGIELNNVTFRYSESMPNVIDDLTLKIRPGQYVAIVGQTGCGKSTLMRILLGFETPQKGGVFYDGKNLSSLDLCSLRRKIGVVMQDGKLSQGDVYSNIVLSAPDLTLDDAWEAAEMAGIAEDIRNMPMGMFTIISEGQGGISGGQRQRLMIARAVAPKPKILMFDEATSALDNITQKKVTESLDSLKCTRIVIAHRLSTIRSCDRIIMLDKGRIIEDGSYEELIKKNGAFAELVARQQIDG